MILASDRRDQRIVENLGLLEGSTLPVGVPVPWPTETAPEGWLICNGNSFDKVRYPKLALAYPSGVLPDLRGEFVRGWDNGRGIDPGRSLLSSQNFAFQDHYHTLPTGTGLGGGELEQGITTVFSDAHAGNFALDTSVSGGNNANLWNYNLFRTYKSSTQGGFSSASETRPRNIAFNYIVRAA
ncbi:phage tail protein [Xenorhabdus bovienii]|uniref:phage tail protein n=1 Tax=Xenorhabdus bovienii TaxID=40576 RepID=UPI00237D2799|nr:phage tail protein [Xenorhabdus bovienii]